MKKALESAASSSTILIGDDTDLHVLLIFHADLNSHDISFASERKNAKNRVWNIKEVKSGLGPFVCKHVLFLHAFSGCDTTPVCMALVKEPFSRNFYKVKPYNRQLQFRWVIIAVTTLKKFLEKVSLLFLGQNNVLNKTE